MLTLFLSLPLLTGTVTAVSSDEVLSAKDAVDGVVSISEAIANHGLTIVIAAAFLIICFAIMFMFIRMNSKMVDSVIKKLDDEKSQNDEVINKLLEKFLEDENKKNAEKEAEEKEHKDLVGLHRKHAAVFRSEIQKVINTLRCDRVAVYVFHNGNKACYGFPFIKMSCIFEGTLKGINTPRSKMHLNMPLHLFNDMVDNLYDNTDFAGNLNEIEIHDNSIKEFLAHSDSQSLFIRAIKNGEDKVAGFTVCEFEKHIDYSDPEVYNNIKFALQDMNAAIRHFITDEKDEIQKKNQKTE